MKKINQDYDFKKLMKYIKKVEENSPLEYTGSSKQFLNGTLQFSHKKNPKIQYILYANGYVRRRILRRNARPTMYQLNPQKVKKIWLPYGSYTIFQNNTYRRVKRLPVKYKEGAEIIIRLSEKYGY